MANAKKEIVLIDADLPDLEKLKNCIKDTINVLEIRKSDDGQAAFAQALAAGADRLHVIAHGGPGRVHLGKAALDRDWAETLPPTNADVSFYACNLAAGHDGRAFVETLKAKVCGTVAVSAREVGHGPQAGWDLTSNGPPSTPFSHPPEAWRHTLITFNGKNTDDWAWGGPGDDVMYGNGGYDNLYGGDGNDYIRGGTSFDWLQGDGGDDEIYGDEGSDYILGGTGIDELHGGSENDTIVGGDDGDFMYGGTGNDFLAGDAGDDEAYGDAGDDSINGDPGNDELYGGDGNDTFNYDNDTSYGPDNGLDIIDGGSGTDSIHYYEDNTTISLRQLTSVEQINVHGYANAKLNLIADAPNPTETVGKTFDLSNTTIMNGTLEINILGNSLGDTLKGSSLSDTIDGGDGIDLIQGNGGIDLLTGGAGDDTFAFANVMHSAFGTADTITDFTLGDLINLSAIDTDTVTAGDQSYSYIGTGAFTGAAGELRYDFDGTNTHVYGTNGSGIADFEIVVAGNVSFSSGDFVL